MSSMPRTGDRVPRLVVNTKPAHQVECVAFDPSGHVLASGSWDMNIEIWDVQSQHLLRTLRGHAARVTAVAFDCTGEILATGGSDGMIRLWNVRTGQPLHAWRAGINEHAVRLAFARDAQLVVSTSDSGSVRWWELATGVEAHSASLPKGMCVPSSDPGRVAHLDSTRRVTLWDPGAGEIVRSLPVAKGHEVFALAFSGDGSVLATGHYASGSDHDATQPLIKVWDCTTGAEIAAFRGHNSSVVALVFDSSGERLASADNTGVISIWDRCTWERRCEFHTRETRESHEKHEVRSMVFQSGGGNVLAVAEGHQWIGRIRLWDTATSARLGAMERRIGDINCITIDERSRCLAVGGEDGKLRLWPLASGAAPTILDGHRDRISALAYSQDGRILASASHDCTARLWDATSNMTVAVIDAPEQLWAIAMSSDGTTIITSSERGGLQLSETTAGAVLQVLRAGEPPARDITQGSSESTSTVGTVHCVALSPDNRILVEGGTYATRLWDLPSRAVIHVLETRAVWRVAFHPTRPIVASGGFDQMVRLWNVQTGTLVAELAAGIAPGTIESGVAIAFRPDGALLAGGAADGTVRLWDADSGAAIATVEAHSGGVTSLAFDASGDLLASGSFDASVVLWNVRDPAQPRQVCTLYAFSDGRWAVIDPEGRFDASDAGNVPWLSWVVGMEPIALDQLKERYYEPQLLRKLLASTNTLLGPSDEPLRDVPTLAEVDLYPAMELLPRDPSDPHIRVRLTDRGGGIGRVVISVNGKEVASDARSGSCDPAASEHLIEIDLSDCPLVRPGEPNVCDVRVHNVAGYLVSRDLPSIYNAPASSYVPPKLWAIVAGISAYRGEEMRLRFAANDAEKLAAALQIGGEQLFGTENVHVQLLTAPSSSAGRAVLATRRNLEQAFETASVARSTDVLVVFLAGHGTSHDGDYYYYTHDARTGDLDDPAVRSQTALSSVELTALFGLVPALKQVLILDTCAAGVLIERWGHARALPSSQIRALDRMKDRMGLYILAGSTADKRAYESSKYNQGILTYSLLFGMRGPALVDEEVDVAYLFNHAVEQVPKLAGNVGGVQRPLIGIPRGGHSFPIGLLRTVDRDRIPIARDLPVVLLAVLEDEESWTDRLELSRRVNSALHDQKVALVDAEMTDAYRLKGRYAAHGDALRVRARIQRGSQTVAELSMDVDPADLDRVAQNLVARFLVEIERSSVLTS